MGLNHIILNDYPLDKVIPYIDWDGFFRRFGLALPADTAALPRVEAARRDFEKDARRLLTEMAAAAVPKLRGVIRFFPALSHNEEIFLYDPAALDGDGAPRGRPTRPPPEKIALFSFPRNVRSRAGRPNPCLADFILPAGLAAGSFDRLGLFALSAGFGIESFVAEREGKAPRHPAQAGAGQAGGASPDWASGEGASYTAILAAGLADAIVEAWSEETHRRIKELSPPPFWRQEQRTSGGTDGSSATTDSSGSLAGIRPAFGYPCCPNHEDKRLAFDLLDARRLCGLDLTESAMIQPAASVCGMYFLNPQSFYFTV